MHLLVQVDTVGMFWRVLVAIVKGLVMDGRSLGSASMLLLIVGSEGGTVLLLLRGLVYHGVKHSGLLRLIRLHGNVELLVIRG